MTHIYVDVSLITEEWHLFHSLIRAPFRSIRRIPFAFPLPQNPLDLFGYPQVLYVQLLASDYIHGSRTSNPRVTYSAALLSNGC